jgi:hypothetical protein
MNAVMVVAGAGTDAGQETVNEGGQVIDGSVLSNTLI